MVREISTSYGHYQYKVLGIFKNSAYVMNSTLRYVCMSMLFGMMLLGIADIGGRYLFNKPVYGTLQIFEILLPAMAILGWSFVQQERAHIRIDILLRRLSSRTQTILIFISQLCMLFVSALIVWQGTLLVCEFWRMHYMISVIDIPAALARAVVPLGALALCFELMVELLQYIPRRR